MKNFTFKAICFFAITLALNSCQEEGLDIQEPVSITDELEKIETTFNEGDVKIENDFSGEKIETDASPMLRKRIEKELMESFTKQKTFSRRNNNNLVAVFSPGLPSRGSCRGARELNVFMDCEDRGGSSKVSGWVGGTGTDRNKNLKMTFCVVPNNFKRTNHDYAVLNISSNVPYSTYRIDRLFDNEDRRNKNYSSYLGGGLPRTQDQTNYSNLTGRNYLLSWIMYPKTSTPQQFPSLFFLESYGVLGKFGINSSNQGYVFSDDEDSRNANRCNIYKYSRNGVRTLVSNRNERTSVLRNILVEGRNTTLHISKVN